MLKICAVLVLAALGLTLVGCKASGQVGNPNSSTSIIVPQ